MRLLLVEDDVILGDGLQAGLRMEGYAVDWLTDGIQADEALRLHHYDIIVLDWNLPRLDGLAVLKAMRLRKDLTPVLLLTARDGLSERITGLDSGADDFVSKPFDLAEICARLRALLRRQEGRSLPVLEHKGVRLDRAAHQVTYHQQPVDLSIKEFEILSFLLLHQGQVISRQRLEETLYAWGSDVDSNAVEVHIHHLRKKLDASLIRTLRGVGYIIDNA